MRKLLAPIVAMTLFLATAGIAMAWQPPTLTSHCAPDENSFAWTINLPGSEDSWEIEFSWDNFATPPFDTIDFGSGGDHDFTTPRGGPILYARWAADHNHWTSLSGDQELCVAPEPGIEIVKSNDADGGTVEPGTKVTYTYEVTNTGNTPLNTVTVNDQLAGSDNVACQPVAFQSSDGNDDAILDAGETWTYTCSATLQDTTENEACVSANVGDDADVEEPQVVEDCDTNEVGVQEVEANTGGPGSSVPNSAIAGVKGPGPLPIILFGMVLVASLGSLAYVNVKVVARRNR